MAINMRRNAVPRLSTGCPTAAVAVAVLLAFGSPPVWAVHDTGVFELDGNSASGGADDFDSVFSGTAGSFRHVFVQDSAEPDSTVHESDDKDNDKILPLANDWGCVTKGNVTDKLDLREAFAASYVIGGKVHVFFGATRDSNLGDANIGFWLFQNKVVCDPVSKKFVGPKTHGDLLIVGPFTGGGNTVTVKVWMWREPDQCLGNLTGCGTNVNERTVVLGVDCVTTPDPPGHHTSALAATVCGTANGSPITVGWQGTPVGTNKYFEGGVNLTDFFTQSGITPVCYISFKAETRSSQSLTAQLEDFAGGELDTCGSLYVEKVTNSLGSPGQSFDFTVKKSGSTIDAFSLTDADPTQKTSGLDTGTYRIEEAAVGAFTTTAKCRGGGFAAGADYIPGTDFSLTVGDQIVCTFVNTDATPASAPPTIRVDKVTIPPDQADVFSFKIEGPATFATQTFSLADDSASHDTGTLTDLSAPYKITETAPPGWALTGATCRRQNAGVGTVFSYISGHDLTVNAGDEITCTFVNTLGVSSSQKGCITVDVVTVTPPSSAGQLFNFTTAGGPSALNDMFSLKDADAPHQTCDLDPGTYTVSQTPVAGWFTTATCEGGPFGSGAAYTSGSNITLGAGDQVSCTFTNLQVRALGSNFCAKPIAQTTINSLFPGNTGMDHVIRTDLGESIQAILDVADDFNGDGVILIGILTNASGVAGGSARENIVINRAYSNPFGLFACSVTLRADNPALPTAEITSLATPPGIVVFDLHPADSSVAGWKVGGSGRYIRNARPTKNAIGFLIEGSNNTIQGAVAERNTGVGIKVTDDGNKLDTVDAMASGSHGIEVIGASNQLLKCDAGERAKANQGDGVRVTGDGNLIRECKAFANAANGISVTGSANQLIKNTAGDVSKGNGGDGIHVAGAGNLLDSNRASANTGDGLEVRGGSALAPNRLKANQSNMGSPGSSKENTGIEYRLADRVQNFGGGNKADNITVPKTSSPQKCPAFPATGATVNFAVENLCE
jgi:hypothetical protein